MDPGFRPGRLVAARLEMPAGRLARERAAGWDRVTERVAAIPGVDAAGLVYALPLMGTAWSASFSLVDPDPDQAELEPRANMRPASPGYFQAAGLKVVRGRGLSESDGPDALPVVVVDETLGRRFWPGRSPVGRRVALGVFSTGTLRRWWAWCRTCGTRASTLPIQGICTSPSLRALSAP